MTIKTPKERQKQEEEEETNTKNHLTFELIVETDFIFVSLAGFQVWIIMCFGFSALLWFSLEVSV